MLKQPKKYYRGVWGKGRDRRKKSSHKGLDCREQKNGRGCFNCSENISQPQNGCELAENGQYFVKLNLRVLLFALVIE